MAIVLTRIDNRLLHGVVATQWAPSTGCTRLMVIDNEVADDPQKKETMRRQLLQILKTINMTHRRCLL